MIAETADAPSGPSVLTRPSRTRGEPKTAGGKARATRIAKSASIVPVIDARTRTPLPSHRCIG
jgi:hypothetical protein